MDLKVMPKSHKGHKFILAIINEVTKYLITVPHIPCQIRGSRRSSHRTHYNQILLTEYIIMHQDSTFMSLLMTYLLNRCDLKIKTVAPYNHQSLQDEHGIKSFSNILTKHLPNLDPMWLKYLSVATFMYNTFNTPNLGNYSPYELTFGRKPRPLINLESNLDIKVSGAFKEYFELLNKRIKYLQNLLFNYKSKR